MKTSKHFLLAVAFVLLAGLGVAMAQDKVSAAFRLPPEPIIPTAHVNAIEVTDGTFGYDGQTKQETAFGYSFLGRTTGAFPGSFTLSMNCTPPPKNVDPASVDGSGIMPMLAPNIGVTGGSWTLPVYMTSLEGTSYAGSLYGTIAKGEMNWGQTGTKGNLYVVLNVDGGTQTWDGVKGYVTFAGTIFVDEKTQKTMLTGDLVFNFISVSPAP